MGVAHPFVTHPHGSDESCLRTDRKSRDPNSLRNTLRAPSAFPFEYAFGMMDSTFGDGFHAVPLVGRNVIKEPKTLSKCQLKVIIVRHRGHVRTRHFHGMGVLFVNGGAFRWQMEWH
jgi:hypothetical protein